MQDKSILITGCSSGMGLAAAKGLKEQGYRVFASARKPEDVESLRQQGFEDAVQLDLDNSESIQNAIEFVKSRNENKLFALFNNAGYQQPGAVEDLSRQALRENFETNLFGTHELTTHVIRIMRQQGYGRIIQNSSVLGFITLPYRGAYNASKFAMEGLTDTLRLELADTAIKVSLIQPGPISGKFRANAYLAFQKNIDAAQSAHQEKYQGLVQRLTSTGKKAPFTLPPEAILKPLLHALESNNPKIRYRLTKPTQWFATAKRLLSANRMDKILLKIAAGEIKRKG